jgi:hypothetical protein
MFSQVPTSQVRYFTFTTILSESVQISTITGNGTGRIFLMEGGSTVGGAPAQTPFVSYLANSNFSLAPSLGSSRIIFSVTGDGRIVNVTGLSAGTQYTVRGFEFNENGYNINTATNNPRTFYTAPAVPQNVIVSNVTKNSFQINWSNPNEGGWDGFEVTVSRNSTFTNILTSYQNRFVAGNSLIVQDDAPTVIDPNSTYYFRVRTTLNNIKSSLVTGPSGGVTTKPDNASLSVVLGNVCLGNNYTLTPIGPSPGNGIEQHKFKVYTTEFGDEAINDEALLSIELTPDDYDEGTTDFWVSTVSNKSGLESEIRTGFTLSTASSNLIVFVSDDYDDTTPGWEDTHFDKLADALLTACDGATVNISNYAHTGDVDMTGYTFIIGDGDFDLDGNLTGGLIQTPSTGRLILPTVQNLERDFPMGNGNNNYTLKIICGNEPTNPIRVRIKEISVAGAIKDPMQFWDIEGDDDLDATIIFRIDKSAIAPKALNTNSILRFFNGDIYKPFTEEQVTINDMGTYYEILIINVNQF